MKIIKRKFNIKPFVNESVVEELEKRKIWDLYENNLLNYIEKYKDNYVQLYFPFIIDSFIWGDTEEGSEFWIDIALDVDGTTSPELYNLSTILKMMKYEDY